MKFITQFIFIIVTAFILELFLPWWSIALVTFAAGVLLATNANFIAGFLGIAVLWLCKALFITMNSLSSLPEKVANIFPLHSKPLLLLVVALIGGLTGGFACLSGALLKKTISS